MHVSLRVGCAVVLAGGLLKACLEEMWLDFSFARPDFADVPGCWRGAHKCMGLGHQFLRSVHNLLYSPLPLRAPPPPPPPVADVPGLLEGAHAGVGLGHQFLRHVQRCRVLVHVIDGTSPDPMGDYRAIRQELELFNPELALKPQVRLRACCLGLERGG